MEVEIATSVHRAVFGGQTYYFCCAHCKAAFEGDPGRFLTKAGSA
jgi:YHS domain-containing protein